MSFDDLPQNWSDLPLDTPGLAADVADLMVGHADRVAGCIALVLTGADLTMGRPALISDVHDAVCPDDLRRRSITWAPCSRRRGALLFVRGREGSVRFSDSDRRWHQVAVEACRAADVRLLAAFLATPAAVRSFPEPLHVVIDDLAS